MNEEQAVQVLILGDHALVRRKFGRCWNYQDIHVVGEARNGLEAIFLVKKFRPPTQDDAAMIEYYCVIAHPLLRYKVNDTMYSSSQPSIWNW